MQIRILPIAVLAATLFVGSGIALEPAEIYDRAREASVEILVEGRLAGSGWFASSDGHVFTAAHVVRGAASDGVTVRMPDKGELPARVVALDPSHDLALIKVLLPDPDEKGRDEDGVDVGASEDLEHVAGHRGQAFLPISEKFPAPGDIVYLFGSAYFRHDVMIRGSVARKEPTYEYLSEPRQYIRCMHISAPSPLGTSGGCWLDSEGHVIGLQSAFLSKDGHGMGIAFSSEPGAIRDLLESEATRVTATLGCGLEETFSQPKAFLARFPKGIRGLVPVLQVKDGAAETAGLLGDLVITHLNGDGVPTRDGFLDTIRARRPGETVTLTVVRPSASEPAEVVVTLGGM